MDSQSTIDFAPAVEDKTVISSEGDDKGKENTEDGDRGFLATFGAILTFARPQALFIILGVVASTIVGGSLSGEAIIFGNVLSRLNICRLPDEIRASASLFGGLFFGLALLAFFANFISTASFGWISENVLYKFVC